MSQWPVTVVFVLSVLACAALAARGPWHEPGTHDEYCYLLAADTFAHGRLTNPPPPCSVHFESIHLIVQSTYMAKYPPGQGLFLALGWILFGHPMMGVYLSFVLATTTICWMLKAWLRSRWALLGGVLAILLLAPTNWANGYWGGAVAAFGGALVFGAVRRLIDGPRLVSSLAFGLGLALLANTRPYEGLVVAVPAIATLLVKSCRRSQLTSASFWTATIAPMVLVLAITAAWMAWYNFRVTGDPWKLPYQLHDETYAAAPTFLWQTPREEMPTYRHENMRGYYVDYELTRFLNKRFLWGINSSLLTKLLLFTKFFVTPVLLVPLVVLARCNRRPWWYFAGFVVALELLSLSQTLYLFPHYAAPVTGLMMGLNVQALRHVRLWKFRGVNVGSFFIGGAMVVLLIGCAIHWIQPAPPNRRADMQRTLTSISGEHLVLVAYGADHEADDEWIYNGADLTASRVIWARDLGPSQNAILIDHFPGRQVWHLAIDDREVVLVRCVH